MVPEDAAFLGIRRFGAQFIDIHEDNEGAIAIATNSRGMSGRTKHVEVRNFFVRDHVSNREIQVLPVPSEENLADLMTKALGAVLYLRFVGLMGLHEQKK